jgi:flagellin
MPTVINTNLASLFAQNSLSNAQNNLAQSVQRLSSGLRINSAKDDTAGLSISQNMQGQINGTNQSIRNLSDATNLLQVADTSLATVQDMILRMKQLAVQGYDGSLSISQKLNIVQELKDLNAEINATAQRTAFNGINLLTSGSSIDLVNSDLKAGVALSNTAVSVNRSTQTLGSVNELGYYAVGGSAGTTGLNDAANTKVGGGGTVSSFNINLDSAKSKFAPGTYTLVNNGANLTLTGTYKGLTQSQTITLANITGNAIGGADLPVNTVANFSDFGIELNINSTIGAGVSYTGTQLAANITARGSQITVNGKGAEISDVRLSGVAPGTYTMTFENTGTVGSLSLPATRSGFNSTVGAAATQVVDLTGGSGTGAKAAISYDATGVVTAMELHAAGTGYKAGDILGTAAVGSANTYTTDRLQFNAMSAGQTLIIGNATLTAVTAKTAAEVATIFSNLTGTSSQATLQANLVTKGFATGSATIVTAGAANWDVTSSSGNAVGANLDTVVFRAAAVGNGATTVTVGGGGSATAPIATRVVGVAAGNLAALTGIAVSTLATESVSTNQLKMTGTINGATTTQSVTLNAGVANAKQLVNFDSFGIQFDVSSYQTQTAKDIGYTLATLNTGSNSSTYGTTGQLLPGQVVVARGNNSELKFQSGATTEAFIQIDTLNVQTGTNGATAGTSTAMMNLGTRVTSSDAGNLGTLGANNTITEWQTAFKNMADATDQALEYVSTQRATYGSQMNRIAYTSTNLQAQSTNIQNSRSAIIDTDFAAETARLTKGQIMQQAATAMLAQANQMPNVILSLLK